MNQRSYSVMAICNPLLDRIVHVPEGFPSATGAVPGTMSLVSHEKMCEIALRAGKAGKGTLLPGGSSANTLRGIAWLSRKDPVPPPVFYGATGTDQEGRDYARLLNEAGVKAFLTEKHEPTGISFVAVTPDSERTMFTCLGASVQIQSADVDFSSIAKARVLYFAGYLFDAPNGREIILEARSAARRAKTLVAFDLADPFVVSRYKEEFCDWIPGNVDILFGNSEEFSILTGALKSETSDQTLAIRSSGFADVVVMKAGEKGAWISEKGEVFHSPGKEARVKDTTGAGDSFAAGFLHKTVLGKKTGECAASGNLLAAAVVEVDGCDYSGLRVS